MNPKTHTTELSIEERGKVLVGMLNAMPQCQVNSMMAALDKGLRAYYSRPENQEKYELLREKK